MDDKSIEDWIISTSQLKDSPENSCFKKLISSYVYSNSGETFKGLAPKLGLSRNNLKDLKDKDRNITLSAALKVCKYFGIPLSKLLNQRYELELTEGMKKSQFMDNEMVEKQLLKILKTENPPLSLKKTAKELGYSAQSLSRYFPVLSSKIVKRYWDYVIENGMNDYRDQLLITGRKEEVRKKLEKYRHIDPPRIIVFELRFTRFSS